MGILSSNPSFRDLVNAARSCTSVVEQNLIGWCRGGFGGVGTSPLGAFVLVDQHLVQLAIDAQLVDAPTIKLYLPRQYRALQAELAQVAVRRIGDRALGKICVLLWMHHLLYAFELAMHHKGLSGTNEQILLFVDAYDKDREEYLSLMENRVAWFLTSDEPCGVELELLAIKCLRVARIIPWGFKSNRTIVRAALGALDRELIDLVRLRSKPSYAIDYETMALYSFYLLRDRVLSQLEGYSILGRRSA